MVVGLALAAVQMGMALPTGFLFGVGYGTGVRIGYEQVYPLLFPKGARPTTSELAATMKGMNTVYDAIGGKDASRMGIAVGITNAGEILKNPDFQVLEQLESSSSGLTSSSSSRSRFGLDQESPQQVLSSEINKFNESSGANIWTHYRTLGTNQLLNITRDTSLSAERRKIAGQIISERQLNPKQTTSTQITPPKVNFTETRSAETLQFRNTMNDLLAKVANDDTYIIAMNSKIQLGNKQAIQWKANRVSSRLNRIKQLRTMSNRYRDPNNEIRKMALLLRQTLQTL